MIDIKFKCKRVNIQDLVGATVRKESVLFNLIRLNAEKKYPALDFDEEDYFFRFKRLELPEAIQREDYIGIFVGFQSRDTFFVCFVPVKIVIEQLVLAEMELGLEEIYCKFNDSWIQVWNKGQYISQDVFSLKDSDLNFVSLKGHPRTEDDEK